MRTGRSFQSILLIGTIIVPMLQTGLPQRSRQSNPGVVAPALGAILQPESVRSILLMHLARTISKAKVTELENDLKKEPGNTDDRLTLIGYYSWTAQTVTDRLHLRNHVLWMIDNHPEHASAAESELRDLLDDPEGNTQISNLWNKNLESRGDDLDVLKNAEKFFFSKDPATAEQLVRRIAQKEPNNQQWPNELAKLYSMFGIPGFPPGDSAEKALEAYKRVLELTRSPVARQALAGDMADTAFRSGDMSATRQLARIHLESSDRSAVQRAHTLLGRVALRSGDLAGARQHLLESATPESARYIAAYSPTMVLAKELLEKGEREAVLQYLENCVPLWPRGESVLQIWIGDIKNGRKPDFGNL